MKANAFYSFNVQLAAVSVQVMCGINARLAKPVLQHPSRGLLQVRTQTSSSHPFQRTHKRNAILSSAVSEALLDSHFLNLDVLCIERGLKCWCLLIDLVSIDDSGSLLDAFILAAVAALKSLKLPKVVLDDEFNVQSVEPSQSGWLSHAEDILLPVVSAL